MIAELVAPALASAVGALIASVTGFGLGSVLTPVLARTVPIEVAIVLTSVPHAIATALRCWLLRDAIDRALLRSFGVASALGGLAGAVVATTWRSPALLLVFGLLLVSSGLSSLTGWARRAPESRSLALAGGMISGFFGGLAGNQGGIRAAALLSARVPATAFVATATAVALLVDLVRVPLYVIGAPAVLSANGAVLLAASVGAIIGTLAGRVVLRAISETVFRAVVSWGVLLLGGWIVWGALR